MKKLLLISAVLLSAFVGMGTIVIHGPASAGVPPVDMDMYISGDGTSGTVTTTTMANCTFSSDAGAWALPDNAGATSISHASGANLGSLRSPIRVNGTTYSGVITNGLRLVPATYTTDRVRRTITGKSQVMIGFFFRANVGTADFNVLDFINMETTGGGDQDWSVAQWKNYSTTVFRVHSSTGTTDVTNSTDNQIYWIQVKFDQTNDLASMAVWSVSGSAYTAVANNSISMPTANDCIRIFIGLEAHGVTSSDTYDWCNLVVDWTSPGAVTTLML